MIDIYFEKNYGKLYEGIEDGVTETFEFSNDFGHIHHMYIKRLIPLTVNGEKYFDLVTPYGYGGPLITKCEQGYEEQLVKDFEKEFEQYCLDNNIVSEFVRFHPIVKNAQNFKDCYKVSYLRNTVGTNLIDYDNPFQSEFSKSCRKNVRRALRDGISYKVTEKPNDVSEFKRFYYSTMDRNSATDYYYFNDDYFNKCIELFKDNLLLVKSIYQEKTIAMGFYFVYNDNIHIHLSGTLSEYLHLSPAYILRYGVTEWGKENGYKVIHHGGGRTNDSKDSLYTFKKQFGKNTDFEFHIGKKVWNKEVYEKLCDIQNYSTNMDFFPAYRSTT